MALHEYLIKRVCHDCAAKPGELHQPGCDTERCPLCGSQAISCDCIYEVNEMPPETLKEDHPEIWSEGATEEMSEKFETEIEKIGGRIPWSGVWPGTEECIEYGFYSRWADRKTGKPLPFATTGGTWTRCGKDDEEAGPDFNRLIECVWDRSKRRFVLPSKVN